MKIVVALRAGQKKGTTEEGITSYSPYSPIKKVRVLGHPIWYLIIIYLILLYRGHSGFMHVLGDLAYYVYKFIYRMPFFCTRNILKLVLEFSKHVE